MMQEVFDKLRNLQDILSKKFEIEREITEIPKALTTKTELLKRLKKSYIDKNNLLEEAKKRLGINRHKLAEAEQKRETYEKQMDLISTQREYEALDKEIRDATEEEQKYRKNILKEEKAIEEITNSLEKEETMIKQQENELEKEQDSIKNESEQKKEMLKELKTEEATIIPGLDEEILFKFERIIKSKSGVGIVPIHSSVCTGCHMNLPDQFVNEVREGHDILFCPYCSRILFFEEIVEGQEGDVSMIFQEDDAGGLADLVDNED
jgi:hypothetical protein